jgi:hypothetical protein
VSDMGPIIQELWRVAPHSFPIVGICQFQDRVIIATQDAVYEMAFSWTTGAPQVQRLASAPAAQPPKAQP